MSIVTILKSLRSRISALFRKARPFSRPRLIRSIDLDTIDKSPGLCSPTAPSPEAPLRCKMIGPTLPEVTTEEARSRSLVTLTWMTTWFNMNRYTLRYRLGACNIRPVAKVSSPRVRFLYDPASLSPMLTRFPKMAEKVIAPQECWR